MAAWLAARLTWQLQQPGYSFPALPQVEVQARQLPSDPAATIHDAHLFGVARQVAEQPKPVQRKPSASLSQFKLLGLLAEGDGRGSAIIEGKGLREATLFRQGDELPGVGQLHRIEMDHVVVNVGGVLESLGLEKADAVVPGVAAPQVAAASAPVSQVQEVKALMERDPTSLTRHFLASPVMRDGQTVGYSIRSRGAYRSLFRELGLRNGDVITEVNGIPLDGPANAFKVYQSLLESNQVAAKLLRGGRNLSITRALN